MRGVSAASTIGLTPRSPVCQQAPPRAHTECLGGLRLRRVNIFEGLNAPSNGLRALALVAIVILAILVNATIRISLRFVMRRAVRRAMRGRGRWTLRLPRADDGNRTEQRRVQRADAAAHMLARLASVLIAALSLVAASHVMGIDPLVFVSSAGFLGAGLAIGGQSLIKDWLTGLLVLLEDRYAVGDHVIMRVSGVEVEGTVEELNSAGVRLRLPDGHTWHAGHASVESVINRSQELVTHRIEVPSDVWSELDEALIGPKLTAASHDLGLTNVVLLADIEAEAHRDGTTSVEFRATRRLTERQRRQVVQRVLEPDRQGAR